MINHLIHFLQWLQTFSYKDWAIIILGTLVIFFIIGTVILIQSTKEILKGFWNSF